MKRITKIIITISLLLVSLTGCQIRTRGYVAVTNYPVYYVASQLVGNKLTVVNISSDEYIGKATIRSDINDLLSHSTVLCYIAELEPYMTNIASQISIYDVDIIDLAQLSSLCEFKKINNRVIEGITIKEEVPYYDSELFNADDTYIKDPFLWLEPIALTSIASTIKDYLCETFPEDTLVFENNFKSLQAKLVRLDLEYQSLKNKNVQFVSVAPTFGCWQKSYNVSVLPVITNSDGSLPTQEQLEFIKQTIKDSGIKYIVQDNTLPENYKELFDSLKEELNLQPIVVSSLSILNQEDIDLNKDYLTIMYENLTNIEKVFK